MGRSGPRVAQPAAFGALFVALAAYRSLHAPEVFAPAGVPFHPCFRGGECPTAVLEDICAADMPIRVLYLSVQTPTAGPGITVLPLRMPDDAWEPAVRATSAAAPPPVLS